MAYARSSRRIFDRYTQPDMHRWSFFRIPLAEVVAHEGASLREDLEDMPFGRFHRVEHPGDERVRHLFVEEVAHRVDENHPGPPPCKRLVQPFGSKGQIESVLEGMARDTPPAL